MANEVRIDLNLKGEQQTSRGLKNVGDAAEKAGDGLQEMAKDAGFLDKNIAELRGGIRELILEFDRAGDKDLLKSIRKENRQLGQFNRLKKQLGELGVEGGREFSKEFTKAGSAGVGMSLKAMKGPLIAGLAGLAILATPLIGATIQAAVLGGTGGLGIIGGLALAARDSRVQDAAAKLGEHTMNAFSRAAEPFIAPAIEAMDLLRGVVDDVSGDMRQAFSTIAPVLLPLTRGIAGLVDEAMPGFIKAMESARPVLRALGQQLPMVGRALSDFFETIAEDPDGAIMALTLLLRIVSVTVVTTGKLVAILSQMFEGITLGAEKVGSAIDSVFGRTILPTGGVAGFQAFAGILRGITGDLEKAKDPSQDFAGSLEDVADSASEAEQKILDLQVAMDKAFGKTMDIQQATLRYEETWDQAIEVLKEGKRTLDATTEAGRENRGALLDQIQAIKDIRQANIDNNMTVEDANTIYDQQIEKLRQTATNLGFNKQQLDDLINAFDSLPSDVELELRVKGLRGALIQMRELTRLLGSRAAAARAAAGDTSGFLGGRAHGGPVLPGQTYVVGENGPEVLQMGSQSGHVFNASQTQQMLSGMSGGAMGATKVDVRLSWAGPGGAVGDLGQVLMRFLRAEARVIGGGDVQRALGR